MKRWSVFVMLAAVVLALLVAGELLAEQRAAGSTEGVRVTLRTQTPTMTRTAGWWTAVATWTPTPTGAAATMQSTKAVQETPTPELNLPPVKTVVPPTRDGGKP